MHGEMSLLLFVSNSTISAAVGRLVGHLCQQDFKSVSLRSRE